MDGRPGIQGIQQAVDSELFDFIQATMLLARKAQDFIQDRLEAMQVTEVNAVQAMLLCSVGTEELNAGALKDRGHYHGSNVSYSLKKLVKSGYLHHKVDAVDRRKVQVSLTDKGQKLRARLLAKVDDCGERIGQKVRVDQLRGDLLSAARALQEEVRLIY
jgi:DNA-binding MarR family transcriptional regulator